MLFMKTKLGIIGGAIVLVIFIVIMYHISTFGNPLQEIFLDEKNPLNESPAETDDAYYYIDEKGVKHFVVEAEDDPKLSDQR